MRFMVLVKATPETEITETPRRGDLAAMTRYNEELAKAGILLGADGLHPSSKGARVQFDGSERTVIDGPFTESKELVAGFWIWDVRSLEEAIEWAKRIPNTPGVESAVELRQIFEADDFAADAA